MVEQEIKELSNLYEEMTKRYRDIKINAVDEECLLEHIVLEDIKNYLMELLNIIPKTMNIACCKRLSIHLLKKTYYMNTEGETLQTDIVLIGDTQVFEQCMTFDNNFLDMKFYSLDAKAVNMSLKTLEFMCAEWNTIKKEIYAQVTAELDNQIKCRLEQIKYKQKKLQDFKDWKI